MSGSEIRRFCETCVCHISNLSVMNAPARAALLEKARTERVCATYYVRLSGEMVTPENPLSTEEKSRVRQLGLAALSAGARALAAGCVSASAPNQLKTTPPAQQQITKAQEKNDDAMVLMPLRTILAERRPHLS